MGYMVVNQVGPTAGTMSHDKDVTSRNSLLRASQVLNRFIVILFGVYSGSNRTG